MRVNIDVEALTLGDLEDIEETIGGDAEAMVDRLVREGKQSLRMKEMNALIWVCARHDDPTVTYEDVRAAKLVDLDFAVAPEAGEGAGDGGSRRSQKSTGTRRRNSEG